MQDPTAPGTFVSSSLATYPGAGQPDSIVIGDVDHDGLPDLITADSTAAYWYKNVNATPGSFQPEVQIGQLGNQ